MPVLAQRNYRWELISALFMPAAVGCVEGGVVGVIAKKAFTAPDWVIAVLAGAPALANVSSLVWTRIFHGHDRVRATNLLQMMVLACVALMALSPVSKPGLVLLVFGAVLARVFLAGVITARADVWRANYVRHIRAKAAGKLSTVTTVVVSGNALLIGWLMDLPWAGEQAFRIVYGASIIFALIGVWAYSHIRWRGRAEHIARERALVDQPEHPTSARAMIGVLRSDRAYRLFMVAQFILGAPNIAAMPIFIAGLEDEFNLAYLPSIILTQILPMSVMIAVIPLWARFMDRVHIIRFRVVHSWAFVAANVLMGVGFLVDSVAVATIARVFLGVAFGGGMLAWQLGHHDFASRELASIYMGIHVTLTGVRGLFAPFIGVALYSGWRLTLGDVDLSWHGMGAWAFLVLSIGSVAGALMFLALHLDQRIETSAPGREG